MKTRYYIDPNSKIRVVARASDDELMKDTIGRVSSVICNLVRVDFFGYWLAKFGMMKLALKFKVDR